MVYLKYYTAFCFTKLERNHEGLNQSIVFQCRTQSPVKILRRRSI